MADIESPRWWGLFPQEVRTQRYWGVGPLNFIAERRAGEWLLSYGREADPLLKRCIVAAAEIPEFVDIGGGRIAFRQAPDALELRAGLADRPVVVRPDQALTIPAGERITLYVSTAAWLQVVFADGLPVLDLPISRPPDTWFGPDTRHGELCYASRSRAKIDAQDAGHWASRAITPVRVRNSSGRPLLIDQIKLPIPSLELYADGNDYLWTDAVLMECTQDSGTVNVRIDSRERSREDWTRLAKARVPVVDRRIPNAFALLFGQEGA